LSQLAALLGRLLLPRWSATTAPAYEAWSADADDPLTCALQAAVLAPSPQNSQPWRFARTDDGVCVRPDLARRRGPCDAHDRELWFALGCAVENLALVARANGLEAEVSVCEHVAIRLTAVSPEPSPLVDAIRLRRTIRAAYTPPTDPGLPAQLRSLARPGVGVHWFDGADADAIHEQTVAATRAILADPPMSEASHSWFRHTAEAIRDHRDGTSLDTTGASPWIKVLGKLTARPTADQAGVHWLRSVERTTGPVYVALTTDDRLDRQQLVDAGRTFQRLTLQLTRDGVAFQPNTQTLERRDRELDQGLTPVFGAWLDQLTEGTPQILFRVGIPVADAPHSARSRGSSTDVTARSRSPRRPDCRRTRRLRPPA
jgi:hypothetical protein